jgi:hypothetical protein
MFYFLNIFGNEKKVISFRLIFRDPLNGLG